MKMPRHCVCRANARCGNALFSETPYYSRLTFTDIDLFVDGNKCIYPVGHIAW